MDIVCLGELLVDMFPSELGRPHAEVSAFRPAPGGAPANVAVAAVRLGARAAFIGKVGDDPFGHYLRDVLARAGVETRGMRFDPRVRTTMNLLAQPDANHYDCFFYRNPGADTRLRPAELDSALIAAAGAFHFGSLSLTDEPSRSATVEAVRIARAGGALISYDVNYRPTLWRTADAARAQALVMLPMVDLLKVNAEELTLLASAHDGVRSARHPVGNPEYVDDLAARAGPLLALGPKLVVVTLGPHGSFFCCADGGGYVPGFAVDTIDATGCGDAFIAGLLRQLVGVDDSHPGSTAGGLFLGSRLRPALRYANAVGALTATAQGVIPALPTAAQVETFLAGERR